MTKIKCEKCGNEKEFAVVAASVFNIYINGEGKTINKEPLTDACTGIDRVECTICREELDEVYYDIRTEQASLFNEKYGKIKTIQVK